MRQPEQAPPAAPGPYRFDPEILREYDVRGQVGKNLSEADAFALGCAFGTFVKRKGGSQVCVGYDGRESSPGLAGALIDGLLSTGMSVENVGLGPTPMLYFAVKDHMADGGIMVTGSHNPADYNGFKMTLQSSPVFGETIQELGRMAAAGDFDTGEGQVRESSVIADYVERLLRDFDGGRALKIAWDCGNGSTGEIVRQLTQKLDGEHILLFDEIDGSFPNHHPDPTVDENLIDLIKTVKDRQCDVGIAFDGDGDRIGVVNEKGDVLRCDMLLAIYAREVLEERKGAAIIGDVKCSQVLFDEIARLGGTPVMWKTGHSLIKDKMAQLKAPLAGELSGHIFFGDKWYGFDDGMYCAIRLMNELCDHEDPLSQITAHLPKTFNTPEVRFEVEESEKFDLVTKIVQDLKPLESVDFHVNDIDGVRVTTPDGWWLLRASNTQNVLVTRAEANSAEALEKMKNMVCTEVEKTGYDVSFPPTSKE
ncbi:MAG: phosphomannomutase/phosphoglucomutase [Rhodospirillales bacterium]|nr:phosphomannomutase/phosphoglucomutase [Rhodospirillales bacterium]